MHNARSAGFELSQTSPNRNWDAGLVYRIRTGFPLNFIGVESAILAFRKWTVQFFRFENNGIVFQRSKNMLYFTCQSIYNRGETWQEQVMNNAQVLVVTKVLWRRVHEIFSLQKPG